MKKTKKRSVRAHRVLHHKISIVLHHKISILGVSGVVIILGITLSVASISLNAKNQEYKAQEAELEKQLEEEKARSEEIDELEEYVGTDEYVEDVAKDKLGLVYPNEILFEAEP